MLWSYFGERDPAKIAKFDEFNISRHVSPGFPPAFVTVGNADPLAPQSVLMADAIKAQGVAVDELYFPPDYEPKLPHEYQFNLDNEADGRRWRGWRRFWRRGHNRRAPNVGCIRRFGRRPACETGCHDFAAVRTNIAFNSP